MSTPGAAAGRPRATRVAADFLCRRLDTSRRLSISPDFIPHRLYILPRLPISQDFLSRETFYLAELNTLPTFNLISRVQAVEYARVQAHGRPTRDIYMCPRL